MRLRDIHAAVEQGLGGPVAFSSNAALSSARWRADWVRVSFGYWTSDDDLEPARRTLNAAPCSAAAEDSLAAAGRETRRRSSGEEDAQPASTATPFGPEAPPMKLWFGFEPSRFARPIVPLFWLAQ